MTTYSPSEALRLRRAIFRKYGSKKAASENTPMEQAIDAAVAPFERTEMITFSNGTSPCKTLDGWWTQWTDEPIPDRVRSAVQDAWPMPATLSGVKEEYDAWTLRDDERSLIETDETGAHEFLSLGCSLRQKIMEELLEGKMRATSVADVLARVRFFVEREVPWAYETETAPLIADLESLTAA